MKLDLRDVTPKQVVMRCFPLNIVCYCTVTAVQEGTNYIPVTTAYILVDVSKYDCWCHNKCENSSKVF